MTRLNTLYPLPHALVVALVAALAVATVSPSAMARKLGSVEVEETLNVGDSELVLNGAGLRKKLFIKLYATGLYLDQKSTDAKAIVAADEPMALTIDVMSDLLTRDKMVAALKEGFRKSTGGNVEPLQTEIDQMITAMGDRIRPGDSVSLAYTPGTGTELSRDGDVIDVIPGLAFKQALFGIWLSDKPAQTSLKGDLLGK